MLVEACEYRANFLHLRPRHAAILGIEPDHFDCYDSLDQIERAFRQFAASVPDDGLLLVRHDCASTRRATAGLACRVESFGLCPEADWSAHVKPRPVVAPSRRDHWSRLYIRDSSFWSTAVRGAVADARPAQRAQCAGRRRTGLGQRRHGGANRRRPRQFCRAAPPAGTAGHVAGRRPGRRLRPSPHRSDRRLGRRSPPVPPPPGVVRLSAAPGLTNGPTAGRIGGQPAKCRQGTSGRDFSGPRGQSPAGGGHGGRSGPKGPRRLASRCCRAIRPKKSSGRWKPVLPPATYWLR